MDYRGILKEKKIKVTQGRLAILKLLSEEAESLTAFHIIEKINKQRVLIDLSTVYRTIETFEEHGLIEKIDLGDGKYSYILKKDNHKHVLECIECHKKTEIECPMNIVGESIRNKTGYTLVEHELNIKVKCKDCNKS